MSEAAREARTAQDVLDFWFVACTPEQWWKHDAAFDAGVRDRFGAWLEDARAGRLSSWEASAEGALALIILLDQFSRNCFRGTPKAFAADERARQVARAAIERDFDLAFPPDRRFFFYMPLEHSEALADQDLSVRLFRERSGDPKLIDYAERHRAVIVRFGRFPHRNEIIGRESTPEELEFLKEEGSRF